MENGSRPRGIQVPFVVHSEAFGYVFKALGFFAIATDLRLVDFYCSGRPTEYPYYNINIGEVRWREAPRPSALGAPKVLRVGMGSRILPRICAQV